MKYTDSAEAPEKTREECAPGAPHVTFAAARRVTLALSNPAPRSGLFSVALGLADGDSVAKLKARLAKEVKAVKGERVDLFLQVLETHTYIHIIRASFP